MIKERKEKKTLQFLPREIHTPTNRITFFNNSGQVNKDLTKGRELSELTYLGKGH